MIGSIALKVVVAGLAMALALAGPARGQEFGTLLCPAYADAARVTAEGMMAGVLVDEALQMADNSVSDNEVRIVLKVVIAFVYQERPTPQVAHDIILGACMANGW